MKGLAGMTKLFDLNFPGGTSNIVGLVSDGTYNYIFVINNADPKSVDEALFWPYFRIYKLPKPTSASIIMSLVDTSTGYDTYIMEEDRLMKFNLFSRITTPYLVDALEIGTGN